MIPAPVILIIIGLIVSAETRLNAVVLGQPVSIPVLWLVAAALVLIIAALVLYLVRGIVRDWPARAPRTVPA